MPNKDIDSARELLAKWLVVGSIFVDAFSECKEEGPIPLLSQTMFETVNYLNKEKVKKYRVLFTIHFPSGSVDYRATSCDELFSSKEEFEGSDFLKDLNTRKFKAKFHSLILDSEKEITDAE